MMDSFKSPNSVPPFGWKVKLNHIFPEKRDQNFTPSFKIVFSLIRLIIRYVLYQFWCYFHRRKPVMDYIFTIVPKQIYGVPLGGIGGGTIGRGFKGEFCRLQMKPGIYEYDIIEADQFIVTVRNSKDITIYQNVLSTSSGPQSGNLSYWKWNFPGENAEYTALYPRSWTQYNIPECNIQLICRQVSPVIPHNYKDSALPGGVLIWTVKNFSSEDVKVSITFCMKGYKGANECGSFTYDDDDTKVTGVEIFNKINSSKCIYVIGVKEDPEITVTSSCFNPKGTGVTLWDQLRGKGGFPGKIASHIQYHGDIAGAVCAQTIIPVDTEKDLEFALVWHMPYIQFRNKLATYERYYTKYFGNDDAAGILMCHYALTHYQQWENDIDNWQNPVLSDNSLPDWYKSAIFNELYFISDGGTIWVNADTDDNKLQITDVRKEFGRFAYLEGHEYRMYNTYDVHFYASFALADLWPKLQLGVQYDFRDAVTTVDDSWRWFLFNGHIGRRKKADCIPHDIGDPEEEPFIRINSYPVHDVSDWKDLNLKFVLQCYRDYVYTEDDIYLKDMWPQVKLIMNCCLKWDTDNDGMIENGGFPDQTYDAWTMSGVSAYCGGLWLAALRTTIEMAVILDDPGTKDKFAAVLAKAKPVFNKKLWNGSYYDFDSSQAEDHKAIMADQLCGMWYLQASGITENILPPENVRKALLTIYENNVKNFKNGESGAVNGMFPNGVVDTSSVQSQEVWTGVTYALSSHLIFMGMKEEGLQTARGIYETVYNRIGMAFETPEALYEERYIRSVGYMRPLSIWSIQKALHKAKNE